MTKLAQMIAEMRERGQKATPGPWKEYKEKSHFYASQIWSEHKHAYDEEDEEYNVICQFPTSHEYGMGSDGHVEHDSCFIAHARTDIPILLDALEMVQQLVKDIQYVRSNPICLHKVADSFADSANQLEAIDELIEAALQSLEAIAEKRMK